MANPPCIFTFMVVGYQFLPTQSAKASYFYAVAGQELRLEPEPNNPYDSNAVAVYDPDTGERIGYMDRSSARDFARMGRAKTKGLDATVIQPARFTESRELRHPILGGLVDRGKG